MREVNCGKRRRSVSSSCAGGLGWTADGSPAAADNVGPGSGPTHLVSMPRPAILRVFALTLALLLTAISKLAEQRLGGPWGTGGVGNMG